MKINPSGKKAYQQIKEQLKQKLAQSKKEAEEKIKEAREYVAPKVKETAKKAAEWVDDKINDPKIKETAKKAADWADERIDDAKEAYETLKQKYNQYTMPTPKLEVLGKKMTELQKEYLFKSVFLNELKHSSPEQTVLIYQREKELQKIKKKAEEATEKYNRFAAQQAAAQRAFDELNRFNK